MEKKVEKKVEKVGGGGERKVSHSQIKDELVGRGEEKKARNRKDDYEYAKNLLLQYVKDGMCSQRDVKFLLNGLFPEFRSETSLLEIKVNASSKGNGEDRSRGLKRGPSSLRSKTQKRRVSPIGCSSCPKGFAEPMLCIPLRCLKDGMGLHALLKQALVSGVGA